MAIVIISIWYSFTKPVYALYQKSLLSCGHISENCLGFEIMKTESIKLGVFTALVIVNLIAVAFGDTETTKNSTNLSLTENLSVNETNQSVQDTLRVNNTSIANGTSTLETTGGIKNFMKSFKFQSNT